MLIKTIKVVMLAATLLLMGLTPNPNQGRQVAGQMDTATNIESSVEAPQKVDHSKSHNH